MISQSLQRFKYIVGDFVSANIGWLIFSCIRYWISESLLETQYIYSLQQFLGMPYVLLGQICVPVFMIFVFYLSGYYNIVFRKSRLQELITTFLSTIVCTMIVYLAILANDSIRDRMFNYEIIMWEWICTFVPTYIIRCVMTLDVTRKIHRRVLTFPTLIIGNGKSAHTFADRLESAKQSSGYQIRGFVNLPGEKSAEPGDYNLYELGELKEVCNRLEIKELLIIPTKHNVSKILFVLNVLYPLNLPIKITPDLFHILISRVKLTNLTGEPLIDVAGSNMTECASNIKRVSDFLFSAIALLLLSPLFLVISLLIRFDSKGNVIYKQERIGYRNKPFNILKFRTMTHDAEKNGVPMLSSTSDDRVTNIGRILRKYRLDELPQFWNVLKGDMAIVGPRPERAYFIEQIMKDAPYYALVHQVRPGLTSMGMVKFGYASSVKEMEERLKYDLIYLENMSLVNDMKIMVYTIKTVLSGKGL